MSGPRPVVGLTREMLEEIVATDGKGRYTLSEDGRRVRANQGHSVEADQGFEVVEPPVVLYHGTALRFLPSIKDEGLVPGSRQLVHLSADMTTAVAVGRRHGTPVVLRVDAAAMWAQGMPFYRSANGVWMTPAVPARFLSEVG